MTFQVDCSIFVRTHLRWCTITYWEYNKPYSQQVLVVSPTCSVYYEKGIGSSEEGFCLKPMLNRTEDKELKKVRYSIGNGLNFYLEHCPKAKAAERPASSKHVIVRMENKCEANCKIYFLGPVHYCKHLKRNGELRPKAIESGDSGVVFNMRKLERHLESFKSSIIPIDMSTVYISFGKRWGKSKHAQAVKRPSVDHCPCWIQMTINLSYFRNV